MQIRVGGVYEGKNGERAVIVLSYRTIDGMTVFEAMGGNLFRPSGVACDVSGRLVDGAILVREIPISDPKHPVQEFGWAQKAAAMVLGSKMPVDLAENYLERHKKSPIRVGDRVRVTRAPKTHEGGWQCHHHPVLDSLVGKVGEVVLDGRETGFLVKFDPYSHALPHFVLEKLLAETRRGEFYRTGDGDLAYCVQGEDEGGSPLFAVCENGTWAIKLFPPTFLTHLPGHPGWYCEGDEKYDDPFECIIFVEQASLPPGSTRWEYGYKVFREGGRKLEVGEEIKLVEKHRPLTGLRQHVLEDVRDELRSYLDDNGANVGARSIPKSVLKRWASTLDDILYG